VLFELLGEPLKCGHQCHIPPPRSVIVLTDETALM